MADNFKSFVVVNPNSANGSTKKDWPKIKDEIKRNIGEFDSMFTQGPQNATKLTREAIKSGYEMVVVVGGDGTINEVANGFFDNGKIINSEAVMGIISRGTGCDFIKTMKIPKELEKAAKVLKGKQTKIIDTGRLQFIDHGGNKIQRYFINIADFGIGGEIVERVNNTTKAFGGFISFLWGTLVTLATYKDKTIKLKIDDVLDEEVIINSVNIANGQYYGSGMHIAPKAKVDDGLFDIVIVQSMGKLEGLVNMPKLYKGTHTDIKKIRYIRGKIIEANSKERVLIDIDGEQPGRLPAKFEIIPKAIRIKI